MKATSRTLRRARGFSMIELMVTVAVIGVLAAVAYPAYGDYARRGKIAEGTGELSTLRVRMEQFYQDNRNYGAGTACGVAMPTTPAFTITCAQGASATWQTFVITATGIASNGMNGYVYTMNESGARATTQFAGATVTATCWMKKAGETC